MTNTIAASATVKDHLDGTTFDPCFSVEKRPLKRVPIFVDSALWKNIWLAIRIGSLLFFLSVGHLGMAPTKT